MLSLLFYHGYQKCNRSENKTHCNPYSFRAAEEREEMYGWSEANVNYLSDDTSRDPICGFPNLRSILCRIEKAG